ncbi:hypothetical protein ZYGR_0AF02440 [Zygosaccharomyces rouxii]|uniref:Nodulin-like domain-containing protein n=1 Tax=Zygosaccharomyces rouxii TaxID=4956 RepID=A0A1Q3A894_ZYGRO|nr:hypothetical protein ZYGR_0AF02440 [Zygosaccharomyces rouxii]
MARPARSKLIKTFVGSNVVAIGAGTPYVYSFYAPQLLAQCHIPVSRVSTLSLSLNLGSSLLGFIAGMVIDKNPALSCLIGTLCTFIGYATLDYCYQTRLSSVFLISAALCLIGYGSISGFYAAVKCCTTNFPHHRGTAGAFPVSLYALAGMMYSFLCSELFGDDIGKVFKFLTVVCSAGIFIGCLTLEILVHPKAHRSHSRQASGARIHVLEHNQPISVANHPDIPAVTAGNKQDQASLASGSSTASSSQSMLSTQGTDSYIWSTELSGSLPFWGWGRERDTSAALPVPNVPNSGSTPEGPRIPTPSYSRPGFGYSATNQSRIMETLPLNNSRRDSFKRNDSNDLNARGTLSTQLPMRSEFTSETAAPTKPKKWTDNYVLRTITTPRFLTYYIILATLQGLGQMYIYCVGFIVQTQVNSLPADRYNINPERIQSIQVSIISILSFTGRLSSGPISDLLVKKLNAQRMWNIVLAGILMFWGSAQMLHQIPADAISTATNLPQSLTNVSFCSAIFGFAFGVLFGTYPAIIADSFGTAAFSTIWGISTSGGLPTIKIFAAILGKDLDKNTNPGEAVCKKGIDCYKHTFHITQACSALIVLITLSLIIVTFWEARHKKSESMDDARAQHLLEENESAVQGNGHHLDA